MLNVGSARRLTSRSTLAWIRRGAGLDAGGHVWGSIAKAALVRAVDGSVSTMLVIDAGGIGEGRGVAAVLALGARAAWRDTIRRRGSQRQISSAKSPKRPSGSWSLSLPDRPIMVGSALQMMLREPGVGPDSLF